MTDTHVLLTKFNAAMPGRTGERKGIDPSWLEQRIALFEQWTVASVAGQTRAPDLWLLFGDKDTPRLEQRRIEGMLPAFGQMLWIDGPLSDDRIAAVVASQLPSGATRLITTRLDSDDALCSTHVERVRFEAQDWNGFLNPRFGYQQVGSRVLLRTDPSSPFLSFAETLSQPLPRTVFSVEHTKAASAGPVRQILDRGMWLQLVHTGNLANAAQGFVWRASWAESDLGIGLRGAPHGEPVSMLRAAWSQMAHEGRHQVRRRIPG